MNKFTHILFIQLAYSLSMSLYTLLLIYQNYVYTVLYSIVILFIGVVRSISSDRGFCFFNITSHTSLKKTFLKLLNCFYKIAFQPYFLIC